MSIILKPYRQFDTKMIKNKYNSARMNSLFLLGASLLYFCFAGQTGYIAMDDTSSFILPNISEGVMPGYSFLLNLLHVIFGEQYLQIASYLQGILASVCVTIFVRYLVRQFALKTWEGYILWLAALLPYSIEMPRYVITHVIYTEAITYSLYYIYFIMLLNLVYRLRKQDLLIVFGMSVFMALIRSQLLLLLVVWGVFSFYYFIKKENKKWKAIIKASLNMIVGVVFGVILVYSISGLYARTIGQSFTRFYANQEAQTGAVDVLTPELEAGIQMAAGETEAASTEKAVSALENGTSQFGSALIVRGFFEAEETDVKYYKSDEMKEIFARLYARCSQKGYLYTEVGHDLRMWEEMGRDYIFREAGDVLREYYLETGMELPQAERAAWFRDAKIKLAVTEICVHPIRFLYHCIRLMIPGFISCIFFNIFSIYLACHLIALFLYGSAFGMACYAIKKLPCVKEGEMMITSILCCIIFVAVTNVVFYGMQRYFLYQMGVFYCAYYILFRNYAIRIWEWKKRKLA